MMRKLIDNVIVLIFICMFVGCGSSSDRYPPDARGVVNEFLGKVVEGDLETALKYCDESEEAYLTMESITATNLIKEFASTFTDNEEDYRELVNNVYIQNWLRSYYEYMFKNYQIVDFSKSGEEYTYDVGISEMDTKENIFGENILGLDVFDEYYYNNQEEIDRMYEQEGVDAVVLRFLKEKAKEIADSNIDALKNNAKYSNRNYRLSLKKIDGQWKIITFRTNSSSNEWYP